MALSSHILMVISTKTDKYLFDMFHVKHIEKRYK